MSTGFVNQISDLPDLHRMKVYSSPQSKLIARPTSRIRKLGQALMRACAGRLSFTSLDAGSLIRLSNFRACKRKL